MHLMKKDVKTTSVNKVNKRHGTAPMMFVICGKFLNIILKKWEI